MLDYLIHNFIILICIALMVLILMMYPLKSKKLQVTMLITLSFVLLMTVAVYLDGYIGDTYQTFTYLRVIFSYMSYTLKVATIGSLLLMYVNKKRDYAIIIGITLVNDLVYSLMFFTKAVVWFDEFNCFHHGSLWFLFFIPTGLYLMMLLYEFYKRNRSGKTKESLFVLSIALSILLATFIEIESVDINTYVETAIVLSCIFFFIEIYASSEQYDTVTTLFNRKRYTTDLTVKWKQIECVIATDLNNLKNINDEFGHEAGDKALNAVGICLKKCSDEFGDKYKRAYVPYRVGGDEMNVLIFKKFNKKFSNLDAEHFISEIQREVLEKGYTISCGYAINDKSKLINEILDLADKNMYINKKELKK